MYLYFHIKGLIINSRPYFFLLLLLLFFGYYLLFFIQTKTLFLSPNISKSIHLYKRYNINPKDVGRVEVGTETLIDKSKSTKTVLMDLFSSSNNTDIEGATIVNACYGGTAALLNAFTWTESDGWDGRYAIVVAADIASYARGPARPTSGVGAVAVLVGRDAPLVFHPNERVTYATNVWDFYKPDHTVEYPIVDGQLSQECYYRALENVYTKFCNKLNNHNSTSTSSTDANNNNNHKEDLTNVVTDYGAESHDYFVFHSPYNKLVQKSYGRLFLLDARKSFEEEGYVLPPKYEQFDNSEEILTKPIEETYGDKGLEKTLKEISATSYQQRLEDSNMAGKLVGNTYTASVFLGLASLIDRRGAGNNHHRQGSAMKDGTSIVVFSYGSGALATMYRLRV